MREDDEIETDFFVQIFSDSGGGGVSEGESYSLYFQAFNTIITNTTTIFLVGCRLKSVCVCLYIYKLNGVNSSMDRNEPNMLDEF